MSRFTERRLQLKADIEWSDLPVATLSRMLASAEIDAVALTEYFIERIESYGARPVFISTTYERAREEARRSAARYRKGEPLGALDGIPVAWKDAIDVAGVTTTAASWIYRDAPPAVSDAPVVANLAAAGMVTLGKTNLSEFAYSALGLNPHFGTPLNPHARDEKRVPGGSSSGAGVVVGARLAPIAIGTDTGGSVRVPAAFNGVVGYKTSELRFDRSGVFALSETLDTIGILAHSVADCMMVDQAMRGIGGTAAPKPAPERLDGLRLIVPENVVMEDLQAEVQSNFLATIKSLEEAGATVVRRRIPELDELKALSEAHGYIASAEAYCRHQRILEGPRGAEVDPFVFRRIMSAKPMTAYDLLQLQQGRLRLQRTLWSSLGNALIVMPTVAHVAPLLASVQDDLDAFAAINAKTIRNTLWANMMNMCALAIPNGTGQAGMPTSISFSAPAGREDDLLGIGTALDKFIKRG
jgi:aspartyl-tRNA(Asn)/glutamyl-tRNA(Gln) amidotransferase subunit A